MIHSTCSEKYPETFDANIPKKFVYSGKYTITDPYKASPINVGKMVLSPTRTYAPLMKEIVCRHRKSIHGIIHCTGGGQTKVLHFAKNVHVIKDNLFDLPPVFEMIQETSNANLKEMFSVFNMGHRLEIYTDKKTAAELIKIAERFNIEAKIIGHCESSSAKKLTIKYKDKKFEY